ncbi:MAG: hypothetical protein ACC660_06345 [Acidimicrobiales bacterium]
MNMPASKEGLHALAAARERRLTVKQAVSAVEVAAAAPAADPGWTQANIRELQGLRAAFDAHVAEVEGEEGLLEELVHDAPRLQPRIADVKGEHPTICAQIDAVVELLTDGGSVEDVRSAALATLLAIARHRQHGADLVYNAYSVDIGAGD